MGLPFSTHGRCFVLGHKFVNLDSSYETFGCVGSMQKVPNPFRAGLDVGPISCKKRSWPLAATTEKPECCVKRPR